MLLSNALFNLIGLAAPLVVGVVALPSIVRGLGPDRFGILSLGLVVLGHFAVFDLGLGRATTRLVADRARARDHQTIAPAVWTAAGIQTLVGAVGGLVLAGGAGLLVESVFAVPPALYGEARRAYQILALAVPVVSVATSFRGVLEGFQKFSLLNAIDAPVAAGAFLLMLGGLRLGLDLPGIVALLVLLRLAGLLALMTAAVWTCPALTRVVIRPSAAVGLLRFGGWLTVSGLVGPVLTYLDRILLGALWSVSLVAYYVAPYELVTRLSIVPLSVAGVLFPAVSALDIRRDRADLRRLVTRSLTYVVLILAPFVAGLIGGANLILGTWLGPDFAVHGTMALQILALGVFVNALALVPYSVLLASGRPDLPAKLHLLELPGYVLVAWWLVGKAGITGAATAWSLRVSIDALLLFVATAYVMRGRTGRRPRRAGRARGDEERPT